MNKAIWLGLIVLVVSVQLQSERALKICGRDTDCKGLTCPQGKKLKCGDDRINELQNICVCEETTKKKALNPEHAAQKCTAAGDPKCKSLWCSKDNAEPYCDTDGIGECMCP